MHTKGEWWTWVQKFASLQFGYACMIGVEADNKQPRVSMCSSAEGEVLSRGEPAGGIREAGHFLCLAQHCSSSACSEERVDLESGRWNTD